MKCIGIWLISTLSEEIHLSWFSFPSKINPYIIFDLLDHRDLQLFIADLQTYNISIPILLLLLSMFPGSLQYPTFLLKRYIFKFGCHNLDLMFLVLFVLWLSYIGIPHLYAINMSESLDPWLLAPICLFLFLLPFLFFPTSFL